MLRSWSVVAFLLVCVLQVGCSCCGQKFGCEGCGPKYWGAYVDDPPRCEPCDCYGNWIGGGSCGSCNTGCTEASCGQATCAQPTCGEPSCGADSCCGTTDGCAMFPWMRCLNRRASFWQMLAACNNKKNSACCPDGCGMGCGEPACCEPACGEPACGEPGCGVAPSCGCGGSHVAVSRSPMRSQPMHMVSRSTAMDYRMAAAPGGCNCGKH